MSERKMTFLTVVLAAIIVAGLINFSLLLTDIWEKRKSTAPATVEKAEDTATMDISFKPSPSEKSGEGSSFDTAKLLEVVKKQAKPYIPDGILQAIVEESLNSEKPLLLLALITVESHFDIFARSSSGAVGCGQIKPVFWLNELREAGIVEGYRDLFDPRVCVRSTEFVFRHYLDKARGNVKKALQLYYCGENNRNCKAGLRYVEKVLAMYGEYSLAMDIQQ